MQQKPLPLVALALVACAGEPFETPPGGDAGSQPTDASRALALPDSGASSVKPPVGFARHASGDIAVFDRTTGDVLKRRALEGPLLDLHWDGASQRAIAVVQSEDTESSALHAYAWDGVALERMATAEPVTGAGRAWPYRGGTLLITEEMSAVWTFFDAELVAPKLGKSLFRPAGLAASADGALIGLDANRFDGGHDQDAIVRVTHDGSWKLEVHTLAAPGRPVSRFAEATEPDTVWLVRKHTEESRYEIAEIDALAPAPPDDFRVLSVPALPGTLEGVVCEPSRDVLIATLSRDLTGGHGEVVLLPLADGGIGTTLPLGAAIESSPWPARHLALDLATGRLLIATSTGVDAFVPTGTALAPALDADASFGGAELRAPLALAD